MFKPFKSLQAIFSLSYYLGKPYYKSEIALDNFSSFFCEDNDRIPEPKDIDLNPNIMFHQVKQNQFIDYYECL